MNWKTKEERYAVDQSESETVQLFLKCLKKAQRMGLILASTGKHFRITDDGVDSDHVVCCSNVHEVATVLDALQLVRVGDLKLAPMTKMEKIRQENS